MTLEFEEALKALDEHIEILKQNLLFLMAEHKPESMRMTQKIITIKRELDKAVQERMKLSQIYYRHTNSIAVSLAGA
jgi:flagellar basal body-associated protein FliL